jgi:hypothetical protein
MSKPVAVKLAVKTSMENALDGRSVEAARPMAMNLTDANLATRITGRPPTLFACCSFEVLPLCDQDGALEVRRVGPRSLQMGFPDGFFPTAFSCFVRSSNERFSAGQHFELPCLSVVVESLDAQGDPEQVLYMFPVPLEDPSLRWMTWHDGVYTFPGLHRPSVRPRRSPPSGAFSE